MFINVMASTRIDKSSIIYYDVTATNLSSTNSVPKALVFQETRNNAFVQCPMDFEFSVVRFTLDTNTLPVIQPEIQANQGDINLTNYSVTLAWIDPATSTEYVQQTYMTFVPQNKQATIPSPPSNNVTGLQNNLTGYYDVYNYQYFIKLLNTTFDTCFTALKAQVTTAGKTLPTDYSPVMSWDVSTKLSILSADQAGYTDDGSTDNYIRIYFNPPLYNLFFSLPFIIESFDVVANGKNCRIEMAGFGDSNLVNFPPTNPTYVALQVIQETPSISIWTPILAIVFTSNSLPVGATNVSSPLLYLNGQQLAINGNNSNIAKVITDLVTSDGVYKPNVVYVPTAEYRMLELEGNTPLTTLDMSVFYRNRVGELIPIRLASGNSATVKLMFRRKGMY